MPQAFFMARRKMEQAWETRDGFRFLTFSPNSFKFQWISSLQAHLEVAGKDFNFRFATF